MRLTTAAYILGAIGVIVSTIYLIGRMIGEVTNNALWAFYAPNDENAKTLILGKKMTTVFYLFSGTHLIVSILLIAGTAMAFDYFLLPWLSVFTFDLAVQLVFIILSFCHSICQKRDREKFLLTLLCTVTLLIEVYCVYNICLLFSDLHKIHPHALENQDHYYDDMQDKR